MLSFPALADRLPISLEAEAGRYSGGGIESAPKASGGKLLGDGWGARRADHWESTFELDAARPVDALIRYGYDRVQFLARFPRTPTPHAVAVSVDGRQISARTLLPDTGDWRIFATVAIPLGEIAAGRHILRLTPVDDHNDLNLDSIGLVPAGTTTGGPYASELKRGAGRFRIRLTPSVHRETLPEKKIASNLERQLAYHKRFLGFDPGRQGTLTVVAQADWPDDSMAAWTSLGNVYLHEREVGTPGGNYAHELFHYFETGLDYPTWWSEGVAFVISMRSDVKLYDRKARVDGEIEKLQRWWDSEGRAKMVRDGVNVVRWWGSERVPADGRNGLYRATNLLIYRLWEREGDAFFRRFYALVMADRKAGHYRVPSVPFEEKVALMLDYANRAASTDLKPFWNEWAMAN